MGIDVRRIDRVTGQFGNGGDQIRRNNRNIFEPSLNSGNKKNRRNSNFFLIKSMTVKACPVFPELFSVIRRKQDDRFFVNMIFFQPVDKTLESAVQVRKIMVV